VFGREAIANCGPCRIGFIEEALAAEFGVHTIVNVVDPAAERGVVVENGGGERLEFVVVGEGGSAVLAGQNIGEEGEPGGDGAAVGFVANRLSGHEVKEFPSGGPPEARVHYDMRRFPACIGVKFTQILAIPDQIGLLI
jgi:hypothetical protein